MLARIFHIWHNKRH